MQQHTVRVSQTQGAGESVASGEELGLAVSHFGRSVRHMRQVQSVKTDGQVRQGVSGRPTLAFEPAPALRPEKGAP